MDLTVELKLIKCTRIYGGGEERGGHGGVLGRVILTFVSLRMTSITLPITIRKSKTFQGSLK